MIVTATLAATRRPFLDVHVDLRRRSLLDVYLSRDAVHVAVGGTGRTRPWASLSWISSRRRAHDTDPVVAARQEPAGAAS